MSFYPPIVISANPDEALAVCMECGAAVVVDDFLGDGRILHEEWHRRMGHDAPGVHVELLPKKGPPLWTRPRRRR